MPKEINTKESVFDRLKRLADEKGLSLSEVCNEANVDRSTVEKWKPEDPKTVRIITALEDAIERLPSKKSDAHD